MYSKLISIPNNLLVAEINTYNCWSLSRVWLFETPWTIARQALLSMEFSSQECWSGLPFPSPNTHKVSSKKDSWEQFLSIFANMFVFSFYTIKTIYLNIKILGSYFPWKYWKMLSYTILLQRWLKSYGYFSLDKWCHFLLFCLQFFCCSRILSFIFQV